MLKRKKIKVAQSKGDKAFDVINNSVMALVLIITFYPLLIVLSSSFSDPYALLSGKVWLLPVKPTLIGFKTIMAYNKIWLGIGNSVFYTAFGTAISMAFSILMAYPLSRKDFTLKNPLSLIFAFTMWFSGGMIPTYLLVRDLGLYDTRLAMLIPNALGVWYAIILRTSFSANAGGEILESAKLDGCDDFRYLISIALPLIKPTIAVVTLYYIVGQWNAYMTPYLYLKKPELQPLQIILRNILLSGEVDTIPPSASSTVKSQVLSELLKYSLVVFATLPMAVIYGFVQKFVVKGIMIGAIKG